ncbi:MAG: anti-sigma factor family protein [Betaproteobacteria bacterium]
MSKPLTDELLHAYVDNALADEERREVERWLAQDVEAAQRVRAYLEQNRALHALFDPVLAQPHTLSVAAPRHAANAPRWLALAATLALGIGIGFALRGWQAGTGGPVTIARDAALAHAAYVPEVRHPVEVTAAEEQHLVAWLSKRLDAPLRAPSLAAHGYQLLGGRLLPPTSRRDPAPLALLMYENAQGKRLSLLVKREANNAETSFRFSEDQGARVFYWIDGPFGYALAGDIDRDELQAIARGVYRQLNP